MANMPETIEIDEEADVAYARLSSAAVARTQEIDNGLIVDFDRDDDVVGIEVLGLRRRVGGSDPNSYLRGLIAGLRLRQLHTPSG